MRVLASCDSKYFREHHKAFYASALSCGYTPLIDIINPDQDLYDKYKDSENIRFTLSEKNNATFYASNRFFIAREVLEEYEEGILVTDIDCFFNKKLKTPEQDIGLFFRNDSRIHAKLAVGIVWYGYTEKSLDFASLTADFIRKEPERWFADQIGVYKAYEAMQKDLSVFKFTNVHMDWEFTKDSYMWTGKGPRKYKNSTYLNRKRELEK